MPLVLLPVGAYLYGRFVDGSGLPWVRMLLLLAAVGFIIYMVKVK